MGLVSSQQSTVINKIKVKILPELRRAAKFSLNSTLIWNPNHHHHHHHRRHNKSKPTDLALNMLNPLCILLS
jgi:hypothetical protein